MPSTELRRQHRRLCAASPSALQSVPQWLGRTADGAATQLASSFRASRLPSAAARGTAAPCTRSFQVFSTPPLSQIRTVCNCRVAFIFVSFLKACILSLKFKFRGLAQFPPLKSFLSSFGGFRNLGARDCSSQSQRWQSRCVRRRSPARSPLPLPSFLPLLPLSFPLPLLPLKFPAP